MLLNFTAHLFFVASICTKNFIRFLFTSFELENFNTENVKIVLVQWRDDFFFVFVEEKMPCKNVRQAKVFAVSKFCAFLCPNQQTKAYACENGSEK